MPKTATAPKPARPIPAAGWGESKTGRPTFVQHTAPGEAIKPAPALKGHYAWWVSRDGDYVRWTYQPLEAPKA